MSPEKVRRIPVSGPWITQREIELVTEAVTHGWYENAGLYQQRFEKAMAEYTGRAYALSLPSCTSGLHLALLALGISPGDEVIVPEITWIATAAPISYVGATPVFGDVDAASWCLSAEAFQECITSRTRAVIVVDLYGNMPDMQAILELAARHGIAVIEDAAQAIGSRYGDKKAGSFGDVSVFSFHGSKTMTTGEGGMLLTDNRELYERCLVARDHGRDPSGKLFWNVEIGYKYRMSGMQAALGLAQLERVEELVARKREIFNWYREGLSDVKGIQMNSQARDVFNTYWMVTVIPEMALSIEKETLIQRLGEHGVDARPVFYPLSMLPAYAHLPDVSCYSARNGTSYRLGRYGVNLPSGFNLDRLDVNYVCGVLKDIFAQ